MYWNYKNIKNRYDIFTATDPNSLYCLLTIKQEVTDLMLSTLRSWVDNYKGNVKVRIDKFSIASIYNLCRVTNNYTYSKTEILQKRLKRRCSSWLDLHWIVHGKHLQACPYFLRWIHMCWKCLKSELLKQSMSTHRHFEWWCQPQKYFIYEQNSNSVWGFIYPSHTWLTWYHLNTLLMLMILKVYVI